MGLKTLSGAGVLWAIPLGSPSEGLDTTHQTLAIAGHVFEVDRSTSIRERHFGQEQWLLGLGRQD